VIVFCSKAAGNLLNPHDLGVRGNKNTSCLCLKCLIYPSKGSGNVSDKATTGGCNCSENATI